MSFLLERGLALVDTSLVGHAPKSFTVAPLSSTRGRGYPLPEVSLSSLSRLTSLKSSHQYTGKFRDVRRSQGLFCRNDQDDTGNNVASSPDVIESFSDGGHLHHFSHSDILWKISSWNNPHISWLQRISSWIYMKALRLSYLFRPGEDPPLIACPPESAKGQFTILEAYLATKKGSDKMKRIGRFGITTSPGPIAEPIQDAVSTIYGQNSQMPATSAAIIFMFVEEEYRKRNLGPLALEIISLIHATEGCNYTILLADDKGSGKLVQWYQRHGFRKAPTLQDFLGSPGGKYGTTMIAPTSKKVPEGIRLEW